MLAGGITLGYRLLRLGVVADGDTLVVRNHWRTYHVSRLEVEAFTEQHGSNNVPWGRSVQVVLTDRTSIGMDVTQTGLGAGRERMRERLEQLRAWRAAGSSG